jgi:hypothetical protein
LIVGLVRVVLSLPISFRSCTIINGSSLRLEAALTPYFPAIHPFTLSKSPLAAFPTPVMISLAEADGVDGDSSSAYLTLTFPFCEVAQHSSNPPREERPSQEDWSPMKPTGGCVWMRV